VSESFTKGPPTGRIGLRFSSLGYDAAVQRQRKHHLTEEVFDGQNHVVSLTVSTADRGRWLENPNFAAIVRDEILKQHHDHPVLAYCIMPDHIHLLLCNAGSTLGKITNAFKGRVSRRVRQKQPDLEVWQPGYWDHIVRKEEGLYTVMKYVLLNPVRAGLVNFWWDYEWLGSPLMGEVGPEFFSQASPEDIMWRELLRIE
jgi:putative transposase